MADEKPPEGTATPASDPAAEDAAYKEGLSKLLAGEATEDPPAAAEAPPKADAEAEDDDQAEETPEAKDDEDAEDDVDDADPKVATEALRKLQKEKRTFEAHKSKVLELEQNVKERESKVARVEASWNAFGAELDRNPVETLLKHNMIPEADYKFWAQQFHLLSPEGLKDPRSRPEAERLRRERERERASDTALRRVEKLEQERAAEKAAAAQDREVQHYVTQLDASLPTYKAKTPLLAKAMEKDAAATKRELVSVAVELATANGDRLVAPGQVLLAWERQQRERMARLGLSVPEPAAAVPSKAKTPTAAKSQGQPPKKKDAPDAEEPAEVSDEEYRAELRRRLKQS